MLITPDIICLWTRLSSLIETFTGTVIRFKRLLKFTYIVRLHPKNINSDSRIETPLSVAAYIVRKNTYTVVCSSRLEPQWTTSREQFRPLIMLNADRNSPAISGIYDTPITSNPGGTNEMTLSLDKDLPYMVEMMQLISTC